MSVKNLLNTPDSRTSEPALKPAQDHFVFDKENKLFQFFCCGSVYQSSSLEVFLNSEIALNQLEFLRTGKGINIGLNGAIKGATEFIKTESGSYYNFNNNDDVDVLSTRSTAAQIYLSLKQGMLDGIDPARYPLKVYISDLSPDTILALWLLENPDQIIGKTQNENILTLLHYVDMLESTEHSYPFSPDNPRMEQIAWIFAPYYEARAAGALKNIDSKTGGTLLQTMMKRIDDCSEGKSKQVTLSTDYEVIEKGNHDRYQIIKESSLHARAGMFANGIKAFVAAKALDEKTFSYEVGKLSVYESFPVDEIIQALNGAEELKSGKTESWKLSRADGIYGAAVSSVLSPAEVKNTIDLYLSVADSCKPIHVPRSHEEVNLPDGTAVKQVSEDLKLYATAGRVMSMEEAEVLLPGFSITLDGYVNEAPKVRAGIKGPLVNFNHHEGVDRLSTRSTSAQIYLGLKQGLPDLFSIPGKGEKFNVFINDPDQDVCLSVWLLRHYKMITALAPEQQERISRLVIAEDLLDSTAGAFPISPDSKVMREVKWIFAPYEEKRHLLGCEKNEKASEQIIEIVEEVNARLSCYLFNVHEETFPDVEISVLGGGPGWKMIQEPEVGGRMRLFSEGTRAYVALIKDFEDGTYKYSLGKMSPYVPFPVEEIYRALNEAEGINGENDCWGGSDTVGGSPRGSHSRLSPEDVIKTVNKVLEQQQQTAH